MHKKKKKNHKNKKQYNSASTNTSLIPSSETLENWHKKYNELYNRHCSLVLSKNGIVQVRNQIEGHIDTTRFNIKNFNIQTQIIELHVEAEELNNQIYLLATECQ